MERIDYAIIGGGVSGLAAAYWLAQKEPEKSIAVIEKNRFVGEEQSGHNSGVDHSRYQHHPDSLKSKLRGHAPISLKDFAKQHNIAYKTTGKLIVASTLDDVARLDKYQNRAETAGVPIERLTYQEVAKMEPNVECLAALYTPTTGIIDAAGYVSALEKEVEKHDGFVIKTAEVKDLTPTQQGIIVDVKQESEEYQFLAGTVINAAGLFGDNIARMVNPDFKHTIKPLRGEYMKFRSTSRENIAVNGHCIYPVPTPIEGMYDEHGEQKTAGGNHITPVFEVTPKGECVIGKNYWVGPLHKVIKDKSDYNSDRFSEQDFIDNLPYFPNLHAEDLELEQTGIQLKFAGYDDWVIERDDKVPNLIHYLADSPGMSGSLDAAYYLVHSVLEDKGLAQKAAA